MKKRLSILLLGALALSACSQNTQLPEPDDEPLLFSAVAAHSQLRSIIATTNYPIDVPFVVEAVHYPAGDDRLGGHSFMAGEKIEYRSESSWWTAEGEYFWPKKGSMVFFAGSPIIPQLTVGAEKGVEVDWSVPDEEATQTDICYAMVSENCETHSAVVPVVFTHALSQICFKARTIKNYSFSQTEGDMIQANVITVMLDSVKISGVLFEGHFTQNPLSWETDPHKTASYTIYRNPDGLTLLCDRYDNPILTKLSTMLLIPQAIPADAYIEEWHHCVVRSSVTDKTTGTIVSDRTYTIPGYSEIPLRNSCARWIQDYKYTYRIAVGLEEETSINLAVTDWIETHEIIIGDE